MYDRRAELAGQPCLHALLIGVSHYPFLPNGSGMESHDGGGYGMGQLASPALTAFKLFELLRARADRLARPLATVRLLLSPSQIELDVEPGLALGTGPNASKRLFDEAILAWRSDAWEHPDGVTLFYFGGHGVQKTKLDSIVLLQDFGDAGPGGMLARTASIGHLVNLLAPGTRGAASARVARRQFYFLDACRSALPPLKKLADGGEPPIIDDVRLSDVDDRLTPIYRALPGTQAYADDGRMTLFGQALFDCLRECGGQMVDDGTGPRWTVTAHSLIESLKEHLRRSNRKHGTDQDCEMTGATDRVSLHYLDGPPETEVDLHLDPPEAVQHARVAVLDPITRQPACYVPVPVNPHPFVAKLKAGTYMVEIAIEPPSERYMAFGPEMRHVEWPGRAWKVRVAR